VYSLEQLSKVKRIFDQCVTEPIIGDVFSWYENSLLFDETIQELKDHFNSCESASEKNPDFDCLAFYFGCQKS